MLSNVEIEAKLDNLGSFRVLTPAQFAPLVVVVFFLVLVGLAVFLQDPRVRPLVDLLIAFREASPRTVDFLIGAGAASIILVPIWLATRPGPKKLFKEDAPLSFVAPHVERFGVKWSPFLIYFGDVRDSIKISAPLCPDCWAPLYYAKCDDTEAECPTCSRKYPFPRGVEVTKELARRHFIGLTSKGTLNFGNKPGPIGLLLRGHHETISVIKRAKAWLCGKIRGSKLAS